ncbi:MAG: hypothetical protein K8R53_12835 [Bacteroidales bacterium]|nr:hypothetical protein [Bacteroidales bacterium]
MKVLNKIGFFNLKIKLLHKLLFFALIYIFSGNSCRKINDNLLPIKKEELIIGSKEGITISVHDKIIMGGYYHPVIFDVDINKDEINDIRFMSEIVGAPGMGHRSKAKVSCLNENTEMFGYFTNDTTFHNIRLDTVSEPGGTTWYYIYHNYTCQRFDGSDNVSEIKYDQFYIKLLEKNDIINKFENFKTDSSQLNEDAYYYYSYYEIAPDTIEVSVLVHYYNCFSFPENEIKYIGIKYTKDGRERLGWVKLSITEGYIISIFESAIQQ